MCDYCRNTKISYTWGHDVFFNCTTHSFRIIQDSVE